MRPSILNISLMLAAMISPRPAQPTMVVANDPSITRSPNLTGILTADTNNNPLITTLPNLTDIVTADTNVVTKAGTEVDTEVTRLNNKLRGPTSSKVTCTFKPDNNELCKDYIHWCIPLQCKVTGPYAHTLKLAYLILHTNSHAQDDDTCGTGCKQIILECLKKPAIFEQVISSLIARWRQPGSPFENDDAIIEKTTNTWHDVAVSVKLQYFSDEAVTKLIDLLQSKISPCETTKHQVLETVKSVFIVCAALAGGGLTYGVLFALYKCKSKQRDAAESSLLPKEQPSCRSCVHSTCSNFFQNVGKGFCEAAGGILTCLAFFST